MTARKAAPVEGEHPVAMATLTSEAGYRGEVRAGRHRLTTDEGPDLGGDDEGPSPYPLLLAALAQCTAATLRMYANRKGWSLGEVKVRARLLRTGDGATKVERIETGRSSRCRETAPVPGGVRVRQRRDGVRVDRWHSPLHR